MSDHPTLSAVTPAPPLATLELVADLMPRSRLARRAMLLQLAGGDSTAFLDRDGRVVAAIGFYPIGNRGDGESLFELWFVNRPDVAAALPTLRRLARLTLARLGETAGVRIRANVAAGNETGRRLARLIGLAFVGVAFGLERWEWPNELRHRPPRHADRQDRARHAGRPEAEPAGAAGRPGAADGPAAG